MDEPGRADSSVRVNEAELLINASAQKIYQALTTAQAVEQWLPPAGATGQVHAFEPFPGGRFEILLRFADAGHGEALSDSDVSRGRFISLTPGQSVVHAASFESDDPAFADEMIISWFMFERGERTLLRVQAENVPQGIDAQGHRMGLESSLENLAAFLAASD